MFWILTNYKVFLESQKIQNTQYNIRYEKKVGKLTLPETYNGEKNIIFKRVIGQLDIYMQNREEERKINLDTDLISFTKNNSKWTIDLKITEETTKLLILGLGMAF